MTYGEILRTLRERKGLTQAQAAAQEGVSKRLWEYWEKDEKLPPPEKTARTRERVMRTLSTSARQP